jgi:hypothetical protein
MKHSILLFIFAIMAQFAFAQTSGGPDAFGYSWKNSDDAQGPVFSWIDISGSGTLVAGIEDDNAVGPFTLPFQFYYYDSSYTEIKIGSNGWVSLNNFGNVASCFPVIPTPGIGGDNLICPFTADLNFADGSITNYGSIYYQTLGTDTFIVSYIDAPFWVNATPDFVGYNTFQVIFDASDYSITFQYLQMEDTLASYVSACIRNSVVGIENKDGSIGLEVYADTILPPDSMAVKFTCPDCFTVGVEENQISVNVYPNPAENYVNVDADGLLYFELIDESGRILKVETNNRMDLSAFSDGIYFLRIVTEEKTSFSKILIR